MSAQSHYKTEGMLQICNELYIVQCRNKFGATSPPFIDYLKEILRRYPDGGQILKELIQNADDAGASRVVFIHDERHYETQSLFVSEHLAIFDPQKKMFGDDEEGYRWSLDDEEDRESLLNLRDQFQSFQNVVSHVISCSWEKVISEEQYFKGTLFRFPLRNEASEISDNLYDSTKVTQLFDSFIADADISLLFLRNVSSITLMHIDTNSFCNNRLKVSASNQFDTDLSHVKQESFDRNTCFKMVSHISQKMEETRSQWLVTPCLLKHGYKPEIDSLASKLSFYPQVDAAFRIDEDRSLCNGRLSCFLPLPNNDSNKTGLPIHINACFGLTDNRRFIKWQEEDQKNDESAKWNELLIKDILPHVYLMMILDAIQLSRNSTLPAATVYNLWPDISKTVHKDRWHEVATDTLRGLIEYKIFHLARDEKIWVSPSDAVFPVNNICSDTMSAVSRLLITEGENLVTVPENILNDVQEIFPESDTLTWVTPSYVRDVLHRCEEENLSKDDKYSLLEFALSDEKFTELQGLKLLPLSDGTFTSFSNEGQNTVLIDSGKFPRTLLPFCKERFIPNDLSHVCTKQLRKLATMSTYNIINLDANHVVALTKKHLPMDWKVTQGHVTWKIAEDHHPPKSWLAEFWKFLSTEWNEDQVIKGIASASSQEKEELKVYLSSLDSLSNAEKNFLSMLPIFRMMSGKYVAVQSKQAVVSTTKPDIPNDLPMPETIVQCANEADRRLLTLLNIELLDAAKVAVHLVDCIEAGSFQKAEEQTVMIWILNNGSILLTQSKQLLTKTKNLKFIETTHGEHKQASDVFDPRNGTFQDLFEAEFFPPHYYANNQEMLQSLKSLGLKTEQKEISTENILQVINHTEKLFVHSPDKAFKKAHTLVRVLNENDFLSKFIKVQIEELKQRQWVPCENPKFLNGSICRNLKRGLYKPTEVRDSKYSSIVGYVMPLTSELTGHVCKNLGLYETPPAEKVLENLSALRSMVNPNSDFQFKTELHSIYKFMQDNMRNFTDLIDTKSIPWIWNKSEFVCPGDIVLAYPPELDLSPYIKKVPEEFLQYENLLSKFGVKKSLSDEEIEDILHDIKQRIDCRYPPYGDLTELKVSIAILDWMRKNGKLLKDSTPVPVMAQNQNFTLQSLSKTVFCDISAEGLDDLKQDHEEFYVIHEEVLPITARWLKVPFLSTRILKPEFIQAEQESFGIEQCGQSEPITQRIKNILKEYDEESDIFKELLQNAEDAGATTCKFLLDFRKHKDPPETLFDHGMALCNGPCLWIFNNELFSQEDWRNIVKLGSASKEKKVEMIGKFGLGFNSVYHVSDIPSILSGKTLLILDPNVTHLEKHILSKGNPGIRLDPFQERLFKRFPGQFKSYEGIFDCDLSVQNSKKAYNGTLIKLPFRTQEEAKKSEISSKVYDEERIRSFKNHLTDKSQTHLLFLKSITSMSLQTVAENALTPPKNGQIQTPLKISREVLNSFPVSNDTLLQEIEKTLRNNDITCPKIIDVKRAHIVKIVQEHSEKSFTQYWLLYSCFGMHESLQMFQRRNEQDPVFSFPIGGIAVPLHREAKTNAWSPDESLFGQAFCFLPLSIETGLPVHVNGTFAVTSNRKGLWEKGVKFEWNKALLIDAVNSAYITTLLELKKMAQNGHIQNYSFHTFWPNTETVSKAFLPMVESFYSAVVQNANGKSLELFSNGQNWCSMDKVRFLNPKIEENQTVGDIAMKVFLSLGASYSSVVSLPSWVRQSFIDCGFEPQIKQRTINWPEFYNIVLKNLSSVDTHSRNTLVLTAIDLNDPAVDDLLKSYPCIPTQSCEKLQFIKQLVNPTGKMACLYELKEGRFLKGTENDFLSPKRIQRLSDLGMLSDRLPLEEIIERAEKISCVWQQDQSICYKRLQCLMEFIKVSIKEDGIFSKFERLWDYLGVNKQFTKEQYLAALDEIKALNGSQPLSMSDLHKCVAILINGLYKIKEEKLTNCLMPDERGVLTSSKELRFNDSPWMPVSAGVKLAHDLIPRPVACHFGVMTTRHHTLKNNLVRGFSLHVKGFGQTEKLTVRIKNIIDAYPSKKDILKELIQNADDAEATEIHFVWDKRKHKTEKIFGKEWELVQGPALCVYNNRTFSDDDLQGIQQLGKGGKRGTLGRTGKYGLGFNSVYHLTDCPSLLTGDKWLCIFDPNLKYVENVTKQTPGCMFSMEAEFKKSFEDVYHTFLPEMFALNSGTMFRLPLRTEKMAEQSEISRHTVTDRDMNELYSAFIEDPEGLILFLKHVTKIQFLEISEDGTQTKCLFGVEKTFTEKNMVSKKNFHSHVRESLMSGTAEHCKTIYTMKIESENEQKLCSSHLIKKMKDVGALETPTLGQIAANLKNIYLPIILVENGTELVKSKQTALVLHDDLEFRPYLYRIPSKYMKFEDFFRKIGVKERPTVNQYITVLQEIYSDSSDKESLQANQQKAVKRVVQQLFCLLKEEQNKTCFRNNPLYLPSTDGRLYESNTLFFNDTVFQPARLEGPLETKLKLLEKLNHCHLGNDHYEHQTLLQFLPQQVRPKFLSDVVSENLEGTSFQYCDEGGCEFRGWFEKHLSSAAFLHGLVCLIREDSKGGVSQSEAVGKCVEIFSKIQIICCKTLQTELLLNHEPLEGSKAETDVYVKRKKDGCNFFLKHNDDMVPKVVNEVNVCLTTEINALLKNCLTISSLLVLGHLLLCDNMEDVEKKLANHGIHNSGQEEGHSALPKPGCLIPEEWHDCLDMNFLNNFESGEYVGFSKDGSGEYFYVIVINRLDNSLGQLRQCPARYKIQVGSDDFIEVSSLDLYQFKREKKATVSTGSTCTDIERLLTSRPPPNTGSTCTDIERLLTSRPPPKRVFPGTFEEIKREIDQSLNEIWNMSSEDKQKAIKRLYLQWHPDKNPGNEELAHEAFKYLQKRIEELQQGKTAHSTSSTCRDFQHFYDTWNTEARSHRKGRERFYQNYSRSHYNFWSYHRETPRPNRGEAKRWYEQAQCDISAAHNDTGGDCSEWCLFKVHQAVEKALIAAMYRRSGEHPNHCSITSLAQQVSHYSPQLTSLPNTVRQLTELGVDGKKTQYPNYHPFPHIPNKQFSVDNARSALDIATKLLEKIEEYIS
ncbi:unnamed protein product [Leuciscus chuanchicus]